MLKIMGKRGCYELLNQLKYVPKRYNALKKNLNSIISSRTLDQRLIELCEYNLINKNILSDMIPEGVEYSITKKGRLLEGILGFFNSLEQTDTGSQKLDNKKISSEIYRKFFDDIKKKIDYGELHNWKKIWPKLISIMENEEIIKTLGQEKENIIEEINSENIVITTEKSTSAIPISLIKEVWENLVIHKQISRNQHEIASYRSSFIFALFLKLEEVELIKQRPLTIGIKEE